jgi:hypothetical protein
VLDVFAACLLAFGAAGLWVCLFSLRSDMFGLGLTRTHIAFLAPLFVLIAFLAALHFFAQDFGLGVDRQAAQPANR